jgi:nucleotide sugar dehydrogenase
MVQARTPTLSAYEPDQDSACAPEFSVLGEGSVVVIDSIGVVGLGMVGGTVARAFERSGMRVCGYDPYLGIGSTQDLAGCPVVMLCVPTPASPDAGLDVEEVWSAVREVEAVLEPGSIVAVKSTVPPGTIDRLTAAFPRIEFADLPEFLVATKPDETFTRPDRVIIGSRSPETAAILGDLIGRVAPGAPVVVVTPSEAELAKLSSNALLAAKVAMANQLADVCEQFGISWSRVKAVIGLDRRIGPDHLSVTEERGFGGACLPKDLDGLIAAAESTGPSPFLLRALADFNRSIRSGDRQRATLDPVPDNGSVGSSTRIPETGRARGSRP